MQRILPLLVTTALCFNLACAQLNRTNTNTKPSKQHIYAFHKYYPGLKPHYRISYDVFKRFQTLSVANYSVIQLFALAAGEGVPVPVEQILIETNAQDKLQARYCYQIIIDRKDSNDLYKLMLSSLHGQFPGYEVNFQYKGAIRYLAIKDRKQLGQLKNNTTIR